MSFNCFLVLDTRRQKKNGSYPIIVRLSINRKSTSVPTNISVLESEWDTRHLKIKSSAKTVKNIPRLNKYLNHCHSVAQNILFELSESQRLNELPLKEVKLKIRQAIDGKSSDLLLGDLIDTHIEKLHKEKRHGNARTFDDLKRFLINYCGTADIPVLSINYKWLCEIETEYKARGHGLNGLSVRLRALRTLINHNKKLGVLDLDFNPFNNYTIKNEKTRKRALSKEDFDKIVQADLSSLDVSMIKARKYFLISYYMLGISFHDLAMLKLENIEAGKIYYRRAKTGRLYAFKISTKLSALLEDYLTGKEPDDFLLPIAKKGLTDLEQNRRIKNAIGRYNKQLKRLACHLDIRSQNMSSYVARHSLATHARDVAKLEMPVISQLMGHDNESITAIYLDSIDDKVIDQAVDTLFED